MVIKVDVDQKYKLISDFILFINRLDKNMKNFIKQKECGICSSENLKKIIDLKNFH